MSVQREDRVAALSDGSGQDFDHLAGIGEVVRDIVAGVLELHPSEVAMDSVLLELGAQSLQFIRVAFQIESRFQVQLPRHLSTPDIHSVHTYVTATAALAATRSTGAPSIEFV